MLGTRPDRKTRRHAAAKAEILAAAWELARTEGLAGISLRELAARVGMRAPSLYSYFDSKHALFDAMFAQGYQLMLDRMRALELPDDPVDTLKARMRQFMDFCQEDIARYQLMFQRTIPGFEPSSQSYSISVQALEETKGLLARAGVRGPKAVDLWTAVGAGLVAQQIANDPGGDRWARLIDDAVDMFVKHVKGRGRRTR